MTESDETRLREELSKNIGPVQASDLMAHAKRDALFVVDPSVELLEAAVALAQDDTPRVKSWLESGVLRRGSPDEVEGWKEGSPLRSAIVQPWVLVQMGDSPTLH